MPVRDQAKLFESFVVTLIRVFVWLIFPGTAYNFIFRNALQNHAIVCGYGAGGTFAARERVAGGLKPRPGPMWC